MFPFCRVTKSVTKPSHFKRQRFSPPRTKNLQYLWFFLPAPPPPSFFIVCQPSFLGFFVGVFCTKVIFVDCVYAFSLPPSQFPIPDVLSHLFYPYFTISLNGLSCLCVFVCVFISFLSIFLYSLRASYLFLLPFFPTFQFSYPFFSLALRLSISCISVNVHLFIYFSSQQFPSTFLLLLLPLPPFIFACRDVNSFLLPSLHDSLFFIIFCCSCLFYASSKVSWKLFPHLIHHSIT